MKRCCEECKFFGPCERCMDLPHAKTVDPVSMIVRSWIRWFPLAIAFAAVAFVAWTVIMVVFVGRYHDALGRMDNRVKILEEKLIEAQQCREVEYWAHQCERGWPNK
jgi:hypothetical protein